MNSNLPDETVIREYLLGTLPEQDWDEIEEKLLSDKEFVDFVDSIEDQIIEEYLTIQNHFLRPPERQRKLLFASVLRSNLKKKDQLPVSIDFPRGVPTKPASRPYRAAMIAAAAVLVLSTLPLALYTAKLHDDVEMAKAKSGKVEAMLAQANRQVASLENKPNVVYPQLSNRSTSAEPFEFTSKTRSVEIQIPLDEPISPPYEVKLRAGDAAAKTLWSQDNLQPTDSGILIFRIPYYGSRNYFVDVFRRGNPASTSPKTYSFATKEVLDSAPRH